MRICKCGVFSVAGNRNGIQEYDRIRDYISSIYLYGVNSRDDFVELGTNGPDEYDACVKLLKSVLPFIQDDALWLDGRKLLCVNRRYESGNERLLANTYMLHSMSDDELVSALAIFSSLDKRHLSKSELMRELELRGLEVSESTILRRIKDLVRYGYLDCHGKSYALRENPLAGLDDCQLLEIWNCVCFFSEITYPRIAGSFLKRSILREADSRGVTLPGEFPFLLRHNDYRNVFDEDIAYKMGKLIEQKKLASVRIQGRDRLIYPVSLKVDTFLGRWYLRYWDEGPAMIRLSDITRVKPGNAVSDEEWNRISQRVSSHFKYSGCSSGVFKERPYQVRVQLCFDNQVGLYRQFRREIRIGRILEENGTEYYVAELHDPGEIVPLLRQYAPWLKILPGEHGLDVRVRADLERMRDQMEKMV